MKGDHSKKQLVLEEKYLFWTTFYHRLSKVFFCTTNYMPCLRFTKCLIFRCSDFNAPFHFMTSPLDRKSLLSGPCVCLFSIFFLYPVMQ